MKAYCKDILKEITHSLGRFLSILLIVAIGVAFFAGVKASVPDMKNSADHYFDQQNLHDIRLLSSMGFSENDVKAIRKVKNIKGLNATYTMDFLAEKNNEEMVIKTIAWENLKKEDPNNINQVRLLEGRYPKKDNECLIEKQKIKDSGFQIGDTITLKSGNEKDIHDYLKETTYTIVGSCYTPDYLNYEKGTSTIGSGSVDTFIMVPKKNFIMEYYTEILITVENAKAENCYSDDYFDITNPAVNALETVGIERSEIRYEEIKKIANEEWEKGYQKYLEGKETFDTKIKEAEDQLDDAKTKLILGQAQLASEKANFETLQITLNAQITQAEATITMYESQLNEAISLQETLHEQYDSSIEDYNETIQTSQQEKQQLEEKRNDPTLSEEEIKIIDSQIRILEQTIASAETAKKSMENTLAKIDAKVLEYEKMIVDANNEIATNKASLADAKQTAEKEFASAEKQLEEGQQQYIDGKVELEKNKKNGEEELAIANENLASGKQQLEKLPEPTWYVLDRNSHYSYRDYESVADRMDGIAKVFPVFFLVVAALVCLTTMTRMVDEQRGVIGTYKALGYSKQVIAIKYIIYSLIAGVIGSIVGCLVGMHLFPSVIFNAWNLMYNLPGLVFTPQPGLALLSSFCVIGVTLLATGFACYKDLMEVPASLMRPKSPKIGKKILLEMIPFIWSRFSFTMKVTARNIFRYKKRFCMTIIGISGCTALLVAGFGIKDSISQIVDIQYGELMKYDAQVSLSSSSSLNERRSIIEKIKENKDTKDALALTVINASVSLNDGDQSVSIAIPDNSEKLQDYVTLRKRKDHTALNISSNGAIVSEKLAINLNAKEGDRIKITLDDGMEHEIKVAAICENYVGHHIYMTPSYYRELCGKRVFENTVLIKLKQATDSSEKHFGNVFMDDPTVSSITFYRGVADNFSNTISSLSFVTYVLTGAAALLAFVVLYNLTNVNISERLREIATIKVLGFYDLEVASYVYRENIFLTLIGSFVGLLLGIVLHSLIMNLAEMSEVMFGRNINASSFLLSVIVTCLFGMLVNIVMYKKLKQIPMVESLKSVE